MLGLLAFFIAALLQAQSGAGITPSQFYRKDFFGIDAYTFQPDLNVFLVICYEAQSDYEDISSVRQKDGSIILLT